MHHDRIHIPPSVADHTRIGSVTKTFTVMALLQLVDQGLVSLDDTIGEYVSDVPNGDTATLADLATMTSGIPTYMSNEEFTSGYEKDPQRVYTPEELINYVRGVPAEFPAGSQMSYSNTNTTLLGMVIEQVTGEPMAQVYRRGLLDPLGLSGTSFPGTSAELPDPHLEGVTEIGSPEGELKNATNWNPSWSFTAGAMISTLEDLRTWTVALGTGGGLISEELQQLREESLNTTVPQPMESFTYALGFFVNEGWWGHNGAVPGYTTYAVYNPESQTSIVVFVNTNVASTNPPGREPADLIGEGLISDIGS